MTDQRPLSDVEQAMAAAEQSTCERCGILAAEVLCLRTLIERMDEVRVERDQYREMYNTLVVECDTRSDALSVARAECARLRAELVRLNAGNGGAS